MIPNPLRSGSCHVGITCFVHVTWDKGWQSRVGRADPAVFRAFADAVPARALRFGGEPGACATVDFATDVDAEDRGVLRGPPGGRFEPRQRRPYRPDAAPGRAAAWHPEPRSGNRRGCDASRTSTSKTERGDRLPSRAGCGNPTCSGECRTTKPLRRRDGRVQPPLRLLAAPGGERPSGRSPPGSAHAPSPHPILPSPTEATRQGRPDDAGQTHLRR